MPIDSVLILGIGNTLLTDEGIGVHVVRQLQATYPSHQQVHLLDGGTLSFTLAEPIARASGLVVVDAARMDCPPGSVRVFCNDGMDSYLQNARLSVHEVGLTDLLDISRLSNSLPRQRCLVGIEPDCLDWGEAPSSALLPAIDEAILAILTILQRWGVDLD